jgi:Ran GTPase-activating protein (RanGAP) involved in mRNA processing and transport
MADESLQERILHSPFVLGLAAIVGLVLVLASLAGLFLVEHLAIGTAVSLEQGAAATQTISAGKVDPANEGKLVHVSGEATTTQKVSDSDMGISAEALRLDREVEMSYYKETKQESKKDGKTVVTYKHEQLWSKEKPKKLESPPAGQQNPSEKPYPDQTFTASDVHLGAFTLTSSQVGKIPAKENLTVTNDMLAGLPGDLKDKARVDGEGRLYLSTGGGTVDNPRVGDVRIRYKVARTQVVTVVARQAGTSFEPFTPEAGDKIDEIQPGELSREEMFARAGSSRSLKSWVMRAVCFVALLVGLFLVIYRQAFVSSGMAPEGIVANVAVVFLAIAFAVCLMMAVSGIRWLSYRPGIGTGLLAAGTIALAALILVSQVFPLGPFASLFGRGKRWSPQEFELFRRTAIEADNPQPRLQLASMLEKKGDPLGEFIRINHDLDTLPAGDPAREALDSRWGELIEQHGKTWLAPLRRFRLEPSIAGHFFPSLWMNHGLVDTVNIDLPGILPEKADQLFLGTPGLRVLEFHNIHTEAGIAGWKDTHYEPDVPAIMQVPQLTQIGVIKVSSLQLKASDLKAIATSPYLENLRELNLSYNSFGPEGAQALAVSDTLKSLRVLQLRSCDLGEEGAVALAKAPLLANLTTLDLGGNAIGRNGFVALARAAQMKNLRDLSLEDNDLGVVVAQAVGSSPYWKELTAVDLSRNNIGEQGAAMLGRSSNLARLTVLKLNHNHVGGVGLRALAASAHLGHLEVLELEGNEIADDGLIALAANKQITRLRELLLSNNNIGDEGIKALAAWPGLARVTKLSLGVNKIGPRGIAALAASPYLRALEELTLSNNDIGPAGAQALAGSEVLSNLKHLWIHEAKLGAEGEAALSKRFEDVVHMT